MKLKKNIAISESGFVFDPSSGDSFSLNPVAIEIMEYLKTDKAYEEINQLILDKYDVDQTTFERYYYDFINTLRQFSLLENE
ncbi:MAG: PqqD family protein [Bacteroidetes bacterium]|nr:MAG: PqqD family protein [Bacteroidota bacterium]